MDLGTFANWLKGTPSIVIYDTDNFVLGDFERWMKGKPSPIQYQDLIRVRKDLPSDVQFGIAQKTLPSDVQFLGTEQKTLLSDVQFGIAQKTLPSDVQFGIAQQTILSDVKFVIQNLYNANNKITFVTQTLSNISNKFSFVKRVLDDLECKINFIKSVLSDINNKINTQLRKFYDITNDVRFIHSWQKPGSFGFQSLGKAYVKVYIGGADQTDVDIDSINIHKQINSAHTASFDLARTYDNAIIPALESTVEIRYYHSDLINYWILFKGYVTSVIPADTPESITVNCQDEYWKQNQTNKYFFVGHNPNDSREKYYDTIKTALLSELGWSLDIGDFVPEIIDCFGQGKSDITSSLISQCGNFGWWYDVDGTKKLWEAGRGTTVDIQRQIIGKNIDIYQLIEHNLNSSAENIVNKYRVQMGQKTGRKDQGGRTYEVYTCSNFEGHAVPAWDSSLEVLANESGTGYGFNYPGKDNADNYKDVFRKYYIPELDPDTESWTDRYPPRIEVYSPGGWWGSIYGFPLGEITDGYSIDYENRTITFTEPIFITKLDDNGEVESIRAPILKVYLWKEIYITYTADEAEDPESDISNPYMFFTDKMGDYPVTIIKHLNLTGLTHQVGMYYYTYPGGIKVTKIIRTFDDTDFAEDYANWQLSNSCDEKINGTFTLTLDALCFYNIDLSKRINIDGITDSALNITSIDYNIANFTVSITAENKRYYKRTVSLPRHD